MASFVAAGAKGLIEEGVKQVVNSEPVQNVVGYVKQTFGVTDVTSSAATPDTEPTDIQPKISYITNDTPFLAEIEVKRKQIAAKTGQSKQEDTTVFKLHPHISNQVGQGDGQDNMTVTVKPNRRGNRKPKCATSNMKVERGTNYVITWNDQYKEAAVVLGKETDELKIQHSIHSDELEEGSRGCCCIKNKVAPSQ